MPVLLRTTPEFFDTLRIATHNERAAWKTYMDAPFDQASRMREAWVNAAHDLAIRARIIVEAHDAICADEETVDAA